MKSAVGPAALGIALVAVGGVVGVVVVHDQGSSQKCHYRQVGSDPLTVLQDTSCTPGAVNKKVTQANIKRTICNPKWVTGRPPTSITNKIKSQSLTDYGLPQSASATTELDHLIPIGAGGDPASPSNLWVEPNYAKAPNPYAHNPKDIVELSVHNAICSGKVTLAAAQSAILTDWTTAKSVLHIGKP